MIFAWWLGTQETLVLLVGGCGFTVVVLSVVLLIVLPHVLRRSRPVEPLHDATPLERARAGADALNPQDREALRRSLEEGKPPSAGSEEIRS